MSKQSRQWMKDKHRVFVIAHHEGNSPNPYKIEHRCSCGTKYTTSGDNVMPCPSRPDQRSEA